MAAPTIHQSRFADLDPAVLYAILRLRVDAFVVEQRCPYPELDGRDTDPGAWHLWIEDESAVVSYLRILGPELRISRVVTSPAHRGRGHAGTLVRRALELAGDRGVTLEAQSHLREWYEGFGFRQVGDQYVEDAIAHIPMRRG